MTDFFDESGSGSGVDVPALMDSSAPDLMWRIVSSGALLSVGRTGDGGAMSVTVTMNKRYRREYFRDSEELVDWLKAAVVAVESPEEQETASRGRRSRTRGSDRGL